MCPQGIDQLGPLPHQQIAYSMLHQSALLLDRLDRDEPHSWAPDRFADRLGVGGIVLVALDVGLHILRRHQTNLVAELRQFTRPIMCRGAGFHADKAWRQSLEELYQLAAAELLSDNDLLSRVDAVNLEHVLGDIQTDRGNLHVDGSSHVIRLQRTTLWHLGAGSGRRPPHQKQSLCLPKSLSDIGWVRISEWTNVDYNHCGRMPGFAGERT